MIKTNITAYRINDELYYRRGKPNGKKKEELQQQIQQGHKPQKWGCLEEDKDSTGRGLFSKTSNCNSTIHAKNKQNIGDLISWLQTYEH